MGTVTETWMTMTEARKRLELADRKVAFYIRVVFWGIAFEIANFLAVVLLPRPWSLVALVVMAVHGILYFTVFLPKGKYWEAEIKRMHTFINGNGE